MLLLLFPLQQVLLLLLCGLLALWFGRRRLAVILLVTGSLWLYLCSTSTMADYLMGRLESAYPVEPVDSFPRAAAIVVLGGSTRGDIAQGRTADLNAQADRLVFATQLYRLGKAPLVLLSGGSAGHSRPEAQEMAEILGIMGLPESVLLLESQSRNTYENAYYSAQLLEKRGIRRVILVTSAFHMARAQAAFVHQGVEVIPAATDYQLLSHDTLLPSLLPSFAALGRTTYALREMAGMLVYRLRGYL